MFKKLFLGVFTFILVAVYYPASAQDSYDSDMSYQLPNGPFELFGQMIDPSSIHTGKDVLGWNELRLMMPVVIPNLQEHSMNNNQLCDYMDKLSESYLVFWERVEASITREMISKNLDFKMEPERYVSDIMTAPTTSGLEKLVLLMPEREREIRLIREVALKAMTVMLLRDAAIQACPDYAKEKGYREYHAGFEGYSPANDPGWKDVPWYKNEQPDGPE